MPHDRIDTGETHTSAKKRRALRDTLEILVSFFEREFRGRYSGLCRMGKVPVEIELQRIGEQLPPEIISRLVPESAASGGTEGER